MIAELWRRGKAFIIILACVLVVVAIAAAWLAFAGNGDDKHSPDAITADYVLLPSMYAEGMVVQRDKPFTVRGTATPDATVTVSLSRGELHSQSTVRAGERGAFSASLDALPAGLEPYTLTITSGDTTLAEIGDVYVGDVFLAAGQSNMEANYDDYYADADDAARNLGNDLTVDDLPECIDDKNVRFIVIDNERAASNNGSSPVLREYNSKGWIAATGNNARHLGYLPQYFAEELRERDPDIPVGIIQTAQASTGIVEHMAGGSIYRTHIALLHDYAIGGVLWYQGEQDSATEPELGGYLGNFLQLIRQYRALFDDDDLPFLYVQLARYDDGGEGWARVRQAQYETMKVVGKDAGVAMTVALDTDEGTSSLIHPLGKELLAVRMADQWEAMRDGKDVPMGPIAMAAEQSDGGATATISFMKGTAEGLSVQAPVYNLAARDGQVSENTDEPLSGIEAAGADGVFHAAQAEISDDALVVSCPEVPDIKQVRYQWDAAPSAETQLYNDDGLPASPFWLQVG